MNAFSKIALAAAALVMVTHANAQVTFYEHNDFQGRSFTTDRQVNNFERRGFNDRASSVVVRGSRWQRWEVCEDPRFSGRCVILRPGDYRSLLAMGLNDRVSSVREVERNARVSDDRYAPVPAPAPVSQVVFFENEDHSIFDCYNAIGGEAWVKTVLDRAYEAEKRVMVESLAVAKSGGGLSNVLDLFKP